jgi:biotin carboxyl carrier protein
MMTEIRKVIVDGEEFEVHIEQEGDVYHATINGKNFELVIPDVKSSAPRKRGGGGAKKRSGTVSANMPGKIVTVEVQLGQSVSEGETVLILEAMKMQNEVTAPIKGVVSAIHCQDGMNVEANVPLIVIEPESED